MLAERLALAVEPPPRVVSLAGVAGEVVDLRLVVRAAQDQGPLARGHGQRHVVGDPARLGVYGSDDLTLRQVQRPRAHHKGPVLLPVSPPAHLNGSPVMVEGISPSPASSRIVGARSGPSSSPSASLASGQDLGPSTARSSAPCTAESALTVKSHDSASHPGRDESSVTWASGSCTHSALPK